jgi:hypothetical protein
MIYCAPHDVIDVYKGGLGSLTEWDPDSDEEFFLHNEFVIGPLKSVLFDRKEPFILPVNHKQPIIDEIVGEHDRCLCPLSFRVMNAYLVTGSQCQSDTVQGLDLWGPSSKSKIIAWSAYSTCHYGRLELSLGQSASPLNDTITERSCRRKSC